MINVMLFIKGGDDRIDQIKSQLSQLNGDHPHKLHVIDIGQDPILEEEFGDKAPILDIGVFRLIWPFDVNEIHYAFSKAEDRLNDAQSKGNEVLVRRISEPVKMTKSDRFSHWFSNHYMVLLNLFVFFYVFGAFLAPTLMKIGWQTPGKVLYKIYSPLCHQLAFRSFFLFGEQPIYPRDLAGVDGVITYGQATGNNEYDLEEARAFLGNDAMGYKLALCQRDIAIYGAILLFGMLFAVTGKKIKPLPWYLWILLGLVPIGLDGFSQLLSQTGLSIFSFIQLRESTPLFRVITGSLFGLATAWFGYPYLEESVRENRREMHLKHAIAVQIPGENEVA